MLIDSHCHLGYFSEDEIPKLLQRAKDVGVNLIQTISTKVSEFPKVLKIAESYENVYCSVGVHPNEADKEQFVTTETLIDLTKNKKVISIGETGLDYHYENSPREIQKQSFRMHIEAARMTGLPVVIHSRDADEDMIQILQEEYSQGEFTAVMHSFTSSQKLCDFCLDLNFYISFSGIITFKNAPEVREIASKVPENRILIETDAPYLAPTPHRGKKNEPAFVVHVAEKLNEIRNCNDISKITKENFFNLFTKCEV